MNVLTYPYYMDFIRALGYYDTVPAPPNASYIIAEFATEITSTVLDTIEVTETTITPNLYNENDPNMQTHWWVDGTLGVLNKEYYPISYSVIVPVEEDKRYYMSYSFVESRVGGAYYWAFTDSEYNQIPMSPMGWEPPFESLKEGCAWVSSFNYCMVSQAVPKNASYIVLYVCSAGLSESTNIVIREATDWEF